MLIQGWARGEFRPVAGREKAWATFTHVDVRGPGNQREKGCRRLKLDAAPATFEEQFPVGGSVLRHCFLSRTPVNSISKSTSALLSGYLLLEIPVNLYKWRAVMQLHSYPGLQVSFSFDPTAFLART